MTAQTTPTVPSRILTFLSSIFALALLLPSLWRQAPVPEPSPAELRVRKPRTKKRSETISLA